MILLHPYNPTPRTIWYNIHHVARDSRGLHETERVENIKTFCDWLEYKFNIDSDYLMETMGKYALYIT